MTDLSQFEEVRERSLVRVMIADATTGHVLVLRRGGNENFGVGLWEILQGSRDQGETFLEAVYREITEEIGVRADMLVESRLASLMPISDDKFAIEHDAGFAEDWSNCNYLLIGENLQENLGDLTLDVDHDEMRWVTLDEARHLLGDDTYSLAGQRMIKLMETIGRDVAEMSDRISTFDRTRKTN